LWHRRVIGFLVGDGRNLARYLKRNGALRKHAAITGN
jgi:ribosomal protein S15P/S13E